MHYQCWSQKKNTKAQLLLHVQLRCVFDRRVQNRFLGGAQAFCDITACCHEANQPLGLFDVAICQRVDRLQKWTPPTLEIHWWFGWNCLTRNCTSSPISLKIFRRWSSRLLILSDSKVVFFRMSAVIPSCGVASNVANVFRIVTKLASIASIFSVPSRLSYFVGFLLTRSWYAIISS